MDGDWTDEHDEPIQVDPVWNVIQVAELYHCPPWELLKESTYWFEAGRSYLEVQAKVAQQRQARSS